VTAKAEGETGRPVRADTDPAAPIELPSPAAPAVPASSMSATAVPAPWAPAPRTTSSFGRRLLNPGPGGRPALQWLLRRNCSITPRQLAAVYLSLCAVSIVISAFFVAQGAPYVAAFAGIELVAVGIALLVFARHAGDHEIITLEGRSLRVEQSLGSRVRHTQLDTEWLAVEPAAGQGSLVQLRGRDGSVTVGRFVRPELRAALAQEIRTALRRGPENEPRP
jgi:uncharacterized membrane protein